MVGFVRICVPPVSEGPQSAVGTTVYTESGAEIKGITSINVRLSPDAAIIAELDMGVLVDLPDDVWAIPFMSEESFLQAAKHYGYEVKKAEENAQR